MRKLHLLFILLCTIFGVGAQVGINTKNPLGVLHIDSQTNTSGTTNTSDDVIVTSAGRLGIGTIAPVTALDIRGQLRIVDGTEGVDKVFTAINSQGLGKWSTPDLKSKIGVWRIVNLTINAYASADEIILKDAKTGPSYIKNDEIALVALDNYRLKIPQGKYIVFINQDISHAEYGTYSIKNAADNSVVYQQAYTEWLSGASFILDTDVDLTVYITWKPIDRHLASSGYYNQIGGPTQRALGISELTFLSLK
jgi:hypothetical protein